MRRQVSIIERIAATFDPAHGLPIWIQFLRPKVIGRIEFSAKLLLSSNSGYSRKRVSLDQIAMAYWQALSRNIGWAVGGKNRRGGVALYTTDGGDHWSINLGDPQSNTAEFSHLRFVDQRHGWMVQGNDQLLRTVDGQNWEVVGK